MTLLFLGMRAILGFMFFVRKSGPKENQVPQNLCQTCNIWFKGGAADFFLTTINSISAAGRDKWKTFPPQHKVFSNEWVSPALKGLFLSILDEQTFFAHKKQSDIFGTSVLTAHETASPQTHVTFQMTFFVSYKKFCSHHPHSSTIVIFGPIKCYQGPSKNNVTW